MNWLTSDTGIIFTYVLLSSVVLYSIIVGRGPWKIKVPMVIIIPFMGFLIMASISRHAGWPTDVNPPTDSIIVKSIIREPNPVTDDPGAIYVWLIPPESTEPRAYKLPYTRQAHSQFGKAEKGMNRGMIMRYKNTGQKVLTYNLPPGHLPTKERG